MRLCVIQLVVRGIGYIALIVLAISTSSYFEGEDVLEVV